MNLECIKNGRRSSHNKAYTYVHYNVLKTLKSVHYDAK